MTQDELKIVLDALKWCHGGEPCGTAEAIAVVEKALANVATNDTSKERVDEMQKQRHEQEPVAWVWVNNKGWLNYGETPHDMFKSSPLYTTPPQRTWVGLNKEEAFELQVKHKGNPFSLSAAVENLLREKNT